MKKEDLRTLVKAIITEVRKVKAEHRGAKGTRVGMVRSKNFPQGKGGTLVSKAPVQQGKSGSNEKGVVMKFLQTAKNTDNLLDIADVAGCSVPPSASRFDPSEIAQLVLNKIYTNPETGKTGFNKEILEKVYNFIIAAGWAKPDDIMKKVVPQDADFSQDEPEEDGGEEEPTAAVAETVLKEKKTRDKASVAKVGKAIFKMAKDLGLSEESAKKVAIEAMSAINKS